MPMEDRRCMINGNGGSTSEKGNGLSFREYLGKWYFRDLKELNDMDNDYGNEIRIVFWFDN